MGYSPKEASLLSKANNGIVEDRIYKLLEEQRLNWQIWDILKTKNMRF